MTGVLELGPTAFSAETLVRPPDQVAAPPDPPEIKLGAVMLLMLLLVHAMLCM